MNVLCLDLELHRLAELAVLDGQRELHIRPDHPGAVVTTGVDSRGEDHVADVIGQIEPMDSVERFEGFGVRVIQERGTFISPTEVKARDHVITARRIVIAPMEFEHWRPWDRIALFVGRCTMMMIFFMC